MWLINEIITQGAQFFKTLLICSLGLLTLGQSTPYMSDNPWVNKAGSMYLRYQDSSMKCRYRVVMLAEEMIASGETFDLVFGTVNGGRHVRIEQNIKGVNYIIEPTLANESNFVETERWHHAPDNPANSRFRDMRVVSWINKVKGE